MRHYKRGRKLGTDASHTKAIKKSLVVNLFINDRIKTTLERAKEIRGDVDRVVTWAKRNTLHSRRLAIAALGDKDLVAEIFSKVEQGLFEGREGGYTRIYKLGKRRGDVANMVIMELVQEPVVKKVKVAADEPEAASRRRGFGRQAKADEPEEAEAAADTEVADETESDAEEAEAAADAEETDEATDAEEAEAATEAEEAEEAEATDDEAAEADAADGDDAEAAADDSADAADQAEPEDEAPADQEAPDESGEDESADQAE